MRTFALQIGISLRDRLRPDDMHFLNALMDELERDKLALPLSPTGEERERATQDLALDLYARAWSIVDSKGELGVGRWVTVGHRHAERRKDVSSSCEQVTH